MTKPLLPLALALSFLAGCGNPDDFTLPGEPPLAGATIGGPFTLTDTEGKTVNWSDFAGKYRVVYFGYTYCPDVCPLDVQRIMKGYELFAASEPELAKQVQPIFITVDPERDTGPVLAEFLSNFPPGMIGLTGTPDQIAVAAKAFAVVYEKDRETDSNIYLVNHTNITYLMGRDGEPIAMLPVDQGPNAVAAELAKWTS